MSSSAEDTKPSTVTPTSDNLKPKDSDENKQETPELKPPKSPSKNDVVASLKRKEMDSLSTTGNANTAKQPRSNEEAKDDGEVLDLALTLGLEPQSRLEVQWDIVDDDTGVTRTHWW